MIRFLNFFATGFETRCENQIRLEIEDSLHLKQSGTYNSKGSLVWCVSVCGLISTLLLGMESNVTLTTSRVKPTLLIGGDME